jgi:hypothetical protein
MATEIAAQWRYYVIGVVQETPQIMNGVGKSALSGEHSIR